MRKPTLSRSIRVLGQLCLRFLTICCRKSRVRCTDVSQDRALHKFRASSGGRAHFRFRKEESKNAEQNHCTQRQMDVVVPRRGPRLLVRPVCARSLETMNRHSYIQMIGLIAALILMGCAHAHMPSEQPEAATAPLTPSVQLRGVWLKKPGYYGVETVGTIGLRKLMEQSGGFIPFNKNSKFPSCFYIVRSMDEFFGDSPNAPIKYPFDGRRAVSSDGSIDISHLPDIQIPQDYIIWFDWVFL